MLFRSLNGNTENVYGCVSTGFEWLFIKLEGKVAMTHPDVFTIAEAPQILGVFAWLVANKDI